MGKFILETIRIMKLDIIIAWDAGEKNGVSTGIDSDYHIDVAS